MSFTVNEQDIVNALERQYRHDDENVDFAWNAWLTRHDAELLEQRQKALRDNPSPARVALILGVSAIRAGQQVTFDMTKGTLAIGGKDQQ